MPQSSLLKKKQRHLAVPNRPLRVKVVVLGDSAENKVEGVGKTSILLRHDGQGFTSLMSSTLGASYVCSKSIHAGQEVDLQIWDTAGQERFRSMVPLYLRGSVAAILVYDITNEQSFRCLDSWIAEVMRTEDGASMALFIMANKCDLEKLRCISTEAGREFAEKRGAHYFETSALNGKGIESAMVMIAEEVLSRRPVSANSSDSVSASHSREPPSPGIHLHTTPSPWLSHRGRKQSDFTSDEESEEGVNVKQGRKHSRSGYGWCCGLF